MEILLKRAYETPSQEDGFRVLVDRLWPRGVAKSSAKIDLWDKSVAPSTPLRKWFGHDPLKWLDFTTRYTQELDENIKAVENFIQLLPDDVVTFVYGAKDTKHTHALILKEYIEKLKNSLC